MARHTKPDSFGLFRGFVHRKNIEHLLESSPLFTRIKRHEIGNNWPNFKVKVRVVMGEKPGAGILALTFDWGLFSVEKTKCPEEIWTSLWTRLTAA